MTPPEYITTKMLRQTHQRLRVIAAMRGETLAHVMDALVQREWTRLRADGRLAEMLEDDGGVLNGLNGREERHIPR